MATGNGNLSRVERRGLNDGAVVAYQSERMLKEQVGTVDAVGDLGSLILCDGPRVSPDDFCRLVTAEPQSAQMALASNAPRGAEDAPQPAQDAQEPARPKSPAEKKPPAKGRQTAFRRGDAKRNHDLWLAAVQGILDLMEGGERRAAAVTKVAADPRFAGIKLNTGTYACWASRLRKAGEVTRTFEGGTNVKHRRQVAEADLHALIDSLRKECNTVEEQRDKALAKVAVLQNNLQAVTLERDNDRAACHKALADLQRMRAPAEDGLVALGHHTLRRLALAVCLAEIAKDSREQLAHMLGALDVAALSKN